MDREISKEERRKAQLKRIAIPASVFAAVCVAVVWIVIGMTP